MEDEGQVGIIDISQIPLAELWNLDEDDTVLGHALRRVLDPKNQPVSAFNSAT